jgi:outer membrane protein
MWTDVRAIKVNLRRGHQLALNFPSPIIGETMFCKIILACLFCLFGTSAMADPLGLQDLCRQAKTHDQDFASARAAFEAGKEHKNLGQAELLPNISMTLEATPTHFAQSIVSTQIDPEVIGAQTANYHYTSQVGQLRLTQPIFDLERFAAYELGKTKTELAAAVFVEAGQKLILRVADAYFNYLLALDNLDLARSQKSVVAAQEIQTANQFRVGAATLTDVEETKARHQLAEARELAALNTVETKRKELEKITGPLSLDTFRGVDAFALTRPEPDDIAVWIEAARKYNLQVQIQRHNVRLAEYERDKAVAGHYPRVILTASLQKSKDPNYFAEQDETYRVGLQLNLPLYEGGKVTASSRQAAFRIDQARHELEASLRASEVLVSQAFRGVVNGVALASALGQAVKSSEITVQGMDAAQRAGLRTNTDVLNAQQQLFEARRDLQRERYSYLFNRLSLQASTGSLTEDMIKAIDTMINMGCVRN